MANRLVVGNMKMNLTAPEINKYLKGIEKYAYGKEVCFCPSALYLPYFIGKNFSVGIQNIASTEEGAYTGEIAASQAKSLKVDYAIVGHSERRSYYGETDEVVETKVKLALSHNLKVILCIGETLEERDSLKTYKVLKRQLKSALQGMPAKVVSKMMIAYEPVWAIGTGRVPSNQEIEDTIAFIKDILKELCGVSVKVLYGGSVNSKNIETLNKIPNVDGYLVGGASTKPEEFHKIIEVVVTQ